MAQTVAEIMNRELFVAREHDRASDLLQYLLSLGITGAPVTGRDERAIGFVSLRDLLRAQKHTTVGSVMSSPVDTIETTTTIPDAAQRFGELGRHHLVCLGEDGRPVGFLSALDVLRGLTGQPVPHPAAFPHWDPQTGLSWSDAMRFQHPTVWEHAPAGAGLFVVIRPRRGAPDTVIWSEAATDVRQRLLDILTTPAAAPTPIASLVEHDELWFRAAHAPSVHALPEHTSAPA